MKNEFVSYEAAVELKQLGFDEPCFGYFQENKTRVIIDNSGLITNSNFSKIFSEDRFRLVTPLYQQAFRFLREEYGDLLLPEYGRVPHFTIISNLVLQDGLPIEESEPICLQQMIQCVKSRSTNFNSIPL